MNYATNTEESEIENAMTGYGRTMDYDCVSWLVNGG